MAKPQALAIPAAVDAERALLGAILMDQAQLLPAAEILPGGRHRWFYDEGHHLIYDAMLTLLERHDAIDLLTVTDLLRRRGDLEKAGGAVYLAELTEYAITTHNATAHARIVRDKALYRGLINISTELQASAFSQDDIAEILNRAHESLLVIATAQEQRSVSSLHDIMRDTIRQAEHCGEHELMGVSTGFHHLDTTLNGFQPGNLIILAARPSMGKSALVAQFALSAAQALRTQPVVLFSLEMSRGEFGVRILCSQANVDSQRMKRGFLNQEEWGRIFNASERMHELPILIDDTSSVSVMDIRTRAKRLQMERGLGIILIDYLQLMSGSSKRSDNRQQEVANISRALKELAKELNVPVLALSQLNREIEHRSPPIPVLADLRDSGALEQDADVVMFIYRGDIYEPNHERNGVAQLIVAKQRNGPTDTVRMSFNKTFARFDELPPLRQDVP